VLGGVIVQITLAAPLASAQVRIDSASTAPANQGPTVVALTLHAAAEPEPALRYQLLPDPINCTPGNAAVIYEEAAGMVRDIKDEKDELSALLATPLDQLDKAKAGELLAPYRSKLATLSVAARRDRCDWDLPVREQGFEMLLPSLGNYRRLARAQMLTARLQFADGQFDQAVRSLQDSFALARDLAKGPSLIQALVAAAIVNQALDVVRELSAQPGAPNLYWALTDLPRPIVNFRIGLDYERSWIFFDLPGLAHIRPEEGPAGWAKINAQELQAITAHMMVATGMSAPSASHWGGERPRVMTAAMGIALFPMAKRYLIEQGRKPEEVEAMPVAGVLATYQLGVYLHHRDNMFKWFGVPYPQAAAGLAAAEGELKDASGRGEGFPFIQLLPALGPASRQMARTDQRADLLRCVEALRLYAAGHDGQLPASLDQITQVPIPTDPLTGKPFFYKVEGNHATLEALPTAGRSAREGIRYEITMVK
jgi:hypothetical protein